MPVRLVKCMGIVVSYINYLKITCLQCATALNIAQRHLFDNFDALGIDRHVRSLEMSVFYVETSL